MIGQTLGDYCNHEELGTGGLGVMCRTMDSKLRQQLAIKVLSEAFVRYPERLARFVFARERFAPLAIFNPSGCELQSSLALFISISYVAGACR